jgi:DNA-binding HxlR family transcriptional regulator
MGGTKKLDPYCSIARSLDVLGERWTFLILREAFDGATRFVQFRATLGVAPNVLTDRLRTLIEFGVLARRSYQEPGGRSRDEYVLTESGWDLRVVLGSLQQWGDTYLARGEGPTVERCIRGASGHAHVGFIDEQGCEVSAGDVFFQRTAAYPGRLGESSGRN